MQARIQMSRATLKMRRFAILLIADETKGYRSSRTSGDAAFQVCDKLRPQLAALMGDGGFRALLSRSLALASAEAPSLRAVRVKADGSLEGPAGVATPGARGEFAEAQVVLVAQLLGLLVGFIGESLTTRLVLEGRPKLSLKDSEFGHGGK